ncbi:MAG TPA: TrkA family potassium uptake protein [Lachnospiraceae bacterium]|nr:TrkA family potassium uptake protein [Lachnospiraceae bacterium]
MSKKSYAVLGLGKFGRSIVEELSRADVDILAVDNDEDKVHKISEFVTYAIKADVRDADTINSLGLSNMDAVVVAMTGDLDASVMGTILAKEAGVPFVIAKAQDEIHTKILLKVGADKVIVPEKASGIRIARSLISGNFIDIIELSNRVRMVEIPIKKEWIGKTLRELNLRQKKSINVIGIRRDSEVEVNLDPEVPLAENISLLVIVDKYDISKLS